MCTIHGLRVHGWVPITIVEDHRISGGEVDTDTASTRTEDEDEDLRVVLPSLDQIAAVGQTTGSVQSDVGVATVGEIVLEDGEHLGHLAVEQHAMATTLQTMQQLVEHLQLARIADQRAEAGHTHAERVVSRRAHHRVRPAVLRRTAATRGGKRPQRDRHRSRAGCAALCGGDVACARHCEGVAGLGGERAFQKQRAQTVALAKDLLVCVGAVRGVRHVQLVGHGENGRLACAAHRTKHTLRRRRVQHQTGLGQKEETAERRGRQQLRRRQTGRCAAPSLLHSGGGHRAVLGDARFGQWRRREAQTRRCGAARAQQRETDRIAERRASGAALLRVQRRQ
mmetsp:Transcript_29015/g.72923  ORF Transcript_29015/g.72923 Transcript_29015/m.72923 type:complete len:339 (+) Transcript_29015:206-1222(+)